MADVNDAGSDHKKSEEVITESQDDQDKAAVKVESTLENDSPVDARTQLANLISLVDSIQTSIGEPDHKKVVYEVFGTVWKS